MSKIGKGKFWTGIPPWIFIGAVAVLLPIFTFMAFENIHRQKMQSTRLLLEKGAALIRSFEAGTRTGMMGMQWSARQLQHLLTETAQQEDIVYLLVTGKNGTILAHGDPAYIGKIHGRELPLEKVAASGRLHWRIVTLPGGPKIFEVFKRFSPAGGPVGGGRHRPMMFFNRFPFHLEDLDPDLVAPPIIFVGLDMTSVELARTADTRHTIVMAAILLLIGFAGVIFLFLAQGYRTTQASLSRIKAFSDNVVEKMPIGLLATDADGNVASLNRAAAAILKLEPGAVLDKGARGNLPSRLTELLDETAMAEGIMDREIEIPLDDGTMVPVEISASQLADDSGKFLGHILLFRDLTELKSLKQEIVRNQRLAAVGRLASGVAHEIRNPLSSIKGFATYFKERYRDVPEDRQIAGIMIQEVDRLNRVVGQLLEFSRPVTLSRSRADMAVMIPESLRMVEEKAAAQQIRIETEVAPDMPAACIDTDRIRQVLLNLYLNAIEAMGTGGTLRVAVYPGPGDDRFTIQVTDSGTGIDSGDLGHIFDPYFTTKPSGTGLGLAIVHNIVEAHGGEINVESRFGNGTTVYVRLPLADREKPI